TIGRDRAEKIRDFEITRLFIEVPIDWDAAAGVRSAWTDIAEHVFENGAGEPDGSEYSKPYRGGDQAVFDRSRAGIIARKAGQLLEHEPSPVPWLPPAARRTFSARNLIGGLEIASAFEAKQSKVLPISGGRRFETSACHACSWPFRRKRQPSTEGSGAPRRRQA